MTKDELRIMVFDSILGFVSESYVERVLKNALTKANGDIDKALQILIDETDHPPVQGGSCGWNDIEWEFMCGYHGIGEAYLPGHRSWNSKPDITFTYKDLLKYIAAGKPKHVQLEMF